MAEVWWEVGGGVDVMVGCSIVSTKEATGGNSVLHTKCQERGSGNENGRWIGMESGPLPPRVVVGEVGGRRWLEEYE